MKRILSVTLALSLFCSLFVLSSAGAEELTEDKWVYIVENGEATVTGFNGTGHERELSVPSVLGGFPVTAIGDEVFLYTYLTNVTVPDGVKSIGNRVFAGCSILNTVTLPDSLIHIGDHAFEWSGLVSFTFPDSVTEVGVNPFVECAHLTCIAVSPDHPTLAITDGVLFEKTTQRLITYPKAKGNTSYAVPQGTRIIGDFAFCRCTSLCSVTSPDSVTRVGRGGFELCTSLTGIVLPDSITEIGDYAFDNCRSLVSVNIPKGVTSIGKCTFNGCVALSGIDIPDNITSIGDYAFGTCHALTSVSIPDSVAEIGANPFSNCGRLNQFIVSTDHPVFAVINNALFHKATMRLIACPCTLKAKTYDIPEGTHIIGDNAFYNCGYFLSIHIPDTVTVIEDYALNCPSLTELILPDSVTTIGEGIANGCFDLKYVRFPAGITSISANMFSFCDSLRAMTIPDSVVSIGIGAFSYCTALKDLVIPSSVIFIGDAAFYACPNINVTVFSGSYAEQYCIDHKISYKSQ